MALDTEALIERAALAEVIQAGSLIVVPGGPTTTSHDRRRVAAALPVIADALLTEVEKLHAPIDALNVNARPGRQLTQVCVACGTDDGNWQQHPCPTVRLCAELREAVR